MATPIRATPTLNLKESIRLVKNMIKNEKRKKLTKGEKEIVRMIRESRQR